MNPTIRLTEELAVVGMVAPQTVDNAAVNTDAVDLSKFNRAVFILSVGATDTTVDFKLQSDDNSNFSSPTDIPGKAVTQFSATDDNKIALIEIAAEEIGAAKERYVRGRVTVGDGTTGAVISVIALGGVPRYYAASDFDLTAVKEIVA